MISRRIILAVWAPALAPAYSGIPLAAAYDARLRRTAILFRRDHQLWTGFLDHDPFLALPPTPGALLSPSQGSIPRIRLHVQRGLLTAIDDRSRRVSTLMPVPAGSSLYLVYPEPHHADVTAVWSFGESVYFTNNDYRNVYRLPVRQSRMPVRPEKIHP